MELTFDPEKFYSRHIGPRAEEIQMMLAVLGLSSLEELAEKIVPPAIRLREPLDLPVGLTENQALKKLKRIAGKNKVYRSFIGGGYYDTFTPPVILRNILENPGWYTQYTPYQPEISQGRLEALLNFQTMVSDLTGFPMANASLLDEATAAAEAMTLCHRVNSGKNCFFVADDVHPATIAVVQTRALPLGINVVCGSSDAAKLDNSFFGALVQYPTKDGAVCDYRAFCGKVHDAGALVIAAADILSLVILEPPAAWGADLAVGSTQRFGVPLGFGGPHAAYLAARDEFKREMPGRIVGVSRDAAGKTAYRLALQTREQHIRREKATSNICTAQVLLAVIAGSYAVYHGPQGLRKISERVHRRAAALALALTAQGLKLRHKSFFDTVCVENSSLDLKQVRLRAEEKQINLGYQPDGGIVVALDETTEEADVADLVYVLTGKTDCAINFLSPAVIQKELQRKSACLAHPVFSKYQSETEMLRYLQALQSRDLSLTTAMIPLGSCTMKLNAAAEMIPITWEQFSRIHPLAPQDQVQGYMELIRELEDMLGIVTGLPAVSLQPNAGSQGEYSGLLAIAGYHRSRKEEGRNVCLIPHSAHGTNPASAALAGMKVVVVDCDQQGNVDLADLEHKAAEHAASLACVMVTYPSTHGVFEESIIGLCEIVHKHGGLVYMDGANMNAQVGLCRPGDFGVDVCHLNLHKTFAIPHGGGGPGIGPIACTEKLRPFLPGHVSFGEGRQEGAVSAAPWGSAGVLPISWMYIAMMGEEGLRLATLTAILNANYVAKKLEKCFPVLYKGREGFVAHECILDLRRFKREIGVEVGDVAKRLMDYGFHAPTVSFPVVETLMIEPTESEPKAELDRFIEAMCAIREEMREVEEGRADRQDNVLKNAPHPAQLVSATEWNHKYSREKAAYPVPSLSAHKFWPAVSRIDNAWGDRNLVCCCPPL